jgi:hypothetical protein
MGQREAIAFGEGVATTMRLKFERLPAALIPGVGKRSPEDPDSDGGDDVDLVSVVEKLRNVPKPQPQATGLGELVSPVTQAGESAYKRNDFGGDVPRGRRLGDGLY